MNLRHAAALAFVVWCLSFENGRKVPKDCPNCGFDLAMHVSQGCVFKTKAECEAAEAKFVPDFYENAEKNEERVASPPSRPSCFEDKSK